MKLSPSSIFKIRREAGRAAAPKLVVDEPRTGIWKHDFELEYYYVTMEMRAESGIERDCCAFLEIAERPGLLFALHWGEDVYNISEMKPQYRDMIGPAPARLDVVFAPVNSPALKDGAMLYSPSPENQGAYGSFTSSGLEGWDGRGCWVAQPLALSGPKPDLSAYLKPGEYHVCLRIYCRQNVLAFDGQYLLTSSEQADALRLEKKPSDSS